MDASALKEFLEGVVGVVEATRFEQLCLFEKVQKASFDLTSSEYSPGKIPWQTLAMGRGFCVGHLGPDMPIWISVEPVVVKNHKLLFWHVTGRYVDYDLITKWFNDNLPVCAFEDSDPRKKLNSVDAQNFANVFKDPIR